jgi:hypothetical protein
MTCVNSEGWMTSAAAMNDNDNDNVKKRVEEGYGPFLSPRC